MEALFWILNLWVLHARVKMKQARNNFSVAIHRVDGERSLLQDRSHRKWRCKDLSRKVSPFCNASSPCCCYPYFQPSLYFLQIFKHSTASSIVYVLETGRALPSLHLHNLFFLWAHLTAEISSRNQQSLIVAAVKSQCVGNDPRKATKR